MKGTPTPATPLPTGTVLVGDARTELRKLPTASVDTVVTSPPYFALRDYGTPGQLGLEATIEEWVANLLPVMDEVARVLKPMGTCWLNVGDTYSRHRRSGAERKSLLLGPERLLLALSSRNWILRSKVIWAKSNPLPASVADRLSNAWEPLYLLVRSPRYFFDLDAIRIQPRSLGRRPSRGRSRGKYATSGKPPSWAGPLAGTNAGLARLKDRGMVAHPRGANPRDVWHLPTAAYRGAHFATFPESLVERPLLATCPERVCTSCGAPWWPSPNVTRSETPGPLRKSCHCPRRHSRPGVVLDPFMGAGTVGVVAERLGRDWLGIELNPTFATLARERITTARNKGAKR